MKIVHIESGLGNQMLSYCEYLALRKMNPNDDIYLETSIYDIPECNETICQWNGYELERIFGITEPKNIRTVCTDEQWDLFTSEVRKSQFWIDNWNYPIAITNALKHIGFDIKNIRGDFSGGTNNMSIPRRKGLKSASIFFTLRRIYQISFKKKYIALFDKRKELFYKGAENIFTGQWLAFKLKGNNRELIDDEIRKTFSFPTFTDQKNTEMASYLKKNNAVAIHARRGDMLSNNWWCYKYGYFRRAVNIIRKNVENPVFVFFTNQGSIDWCKENANIFGLDFDKDKISFVDWNSNEESYRDMQLMGHCKHAIITNSSFGWWGAYFIDNPDKITISPSIEIDTTHHC